MKEKIRVITVCLLVLLSLILLSVLIRTKSYEISYNLDGYTIEEMFDKELNTYLIRTEVDNTVYEISVQHEYLYSKKVIKRVYTSESGNNKCIYLESDKLETYPVCNIGDETASYSLLKSEVSFENFTLKDLKGNVQMYNDKFIRAIPNSYLIWNHYGYDYISSKENKSINFLKNESYADVYSFKIGKYILIPNYDEEYTFTSFIVVNASNGKYSAWDTHLELSYNFYFMGEVDDIGYIVDKKSKKEYKVDVQKRKIELISGDNEGLVYDGTWSKISMTKLASNEYKFNLKSSVYYFIKNDALYMRYDGGKVDIRITDEAISRIVSYDGDYVYYLIKDKLYRYSPLYGNTLILEYNEWQFNEGNTVYIY